MAGLKQLTTARLIDELGIRKNAAAVAKQKLDAVKAELLQRGVDAGEGEMFSFTVTTTTSERLDTKAVRDLLTPGAIRQASKTVVATQWHIHTLTEAKSAA